MSFIEKTTFFLSTFILVFFGILCHSPEQKGSEMESNSKKHPRKVNGAKVTVSLPANAFNAVRAIQEKEGSNSPAGIIRMALLYYLLEMGFKIDFATHVTKGERTDIDNTETEVKFRNSEIKNIFISSKNIKEYARMAERLSLIREKMKDFILDQDQDREINIGIYHNAEDEESKAAKP